MVQKLWNIKNEMKHRIGYILQCLCHHFLFNYEVVMIKINTFLKAYKTTINYDYHLNCALKYACTYTRPQTMFHANPSILCPCCDVLFYILNRHEYRFWS